MRTDLNKLINKHEGTYPAGKTWYETDGETNEILLTAQAGWKYLTKNELLSSDDGGWVISPAHFGWNLLTKAYLKLIETDSLDDELSQNRWTDSELKFIKEIRDKQYEVAMEDLKAIDSEDDDDEIDTTFLKKLAGETSETVKTYESGAIRANVGKLRWDLLPYEAITEIVKVLGDGAEAYGEKNWTKGFPWMSVFASLMRHLTSWVLGEDRDKKSGHYHLAHAGCNILFLLTFHIRKLGIDDREKLPIQ